MTIWSGIITTILFFSSSIAYAAAQISLVTLDWAPLTDSKAADEGSITKIVVQAFKTQGVETKIYFMPWARAMKAVERGEFVGIFPAYFSKEREKNFYFSDNIQTIKVGFVKLKSTKIDYQFEEKNLNKTYDIFKKNNYKIGVIKSYANEEIFDKRNDINKEVYGADEQAIKAIMEHKIDMYFGDNIFYSYFLANNAPDELNKFEFIKPAILEKGLYLLFPKKLPNAKELRDKFNAGLKLALKK